MNKRILLLAFSLYSCLFINAQEYAFGIKAGFNQYNIGDIISYGGSFPGGQPNEVFSPNKEIGFQFGAFLDIAFDKFYVRPELSYISNKNNYSFPVKASNWRASKINFPILVGYKVFDPVSIYLGPSFDFFTDVTLEGINNEKGASPINYEKSATSIMFGVQVEFKRFGIDLRYETGLKETSEERQDFHFSDYGINQADIYAYKPSQISLSVNVFLFRTNSENIGGLFSGLFKSSKCYCPGD